MAYLADNQTVSRPTINKNDGDRRGRLSTILV